MMEAAFAQTNNIQVQRRRGVRSVRVPGLISESVSRCSMGLASWGKLTVWLIKWAEQRFPLHLGILLCFDSLLFASSSPCAPSPFWSSLFLYLVLFFIIIIVILKRFVPFDLYVRCCKISIKTKELRFITVRVNMSAVSVCFFLPF